MRIPGLDLTPCAGDLNALPWRSTRYEGIEWLALAEAEAPSGELASESAGEPAGRAGSTRGASPMAQTVLIRMAAGRGYPTHRHLGPEDVLILAGGYRDGEDGLVLTAGQFHRYPAGSSHTPVALGSPGDGTPCVLFAVAHGGTELVPTA